MVTRTAPLRGEREDGFTLIELLVVVIIIGILAAIAIPTFLGQRAGAHDAGARSDLRNAGSAEEAYVATPGATSYTTTAADLVTNGFRSTAGVIGYVAIDGMSGFCLVDNAVSGKGKWFLYDSGNGGLRSAQYDTQAAAEGACSDATAAGGPWTKFEG